MTFTPGKFYTAPYANRGEIVCVCVDKADYLAKHKDAVGVCVGDKHPGQIMRDTDMAGGFDDEGFGETMAGEPVREILNPRADLKLPALLFIIEGPTSVGQFVRRLWEDAKDGKELV